ncbi:hypothetical protein GCG54_00006840 [Colletotrichum gloeosporioides]|uniref:Uncharacterized protein n=1 Tax=Colletotrichum gloeosporioides TaxID=474922 RepID=A0A8H4CQV7_COLGL|nr:uncharacterized protein GCG54_00006840 [Colletotrichum gloeosporioides]KAF3808222.1 hypothetical protein GCG54_00006840 [Colletotrichum gloeosporioides]
MSQPQPLTTESSAAAAVQQPPPVHVRDPIVATTRPTSPVSAASLNSSQYISHGTAFAAFFKS